MIRPVSRFAHLMRGNKGDLLPRYLLTSPGSLYEAFEADADWTLYSGGAKATNVTQVHQGAASEKETSRSGLQSLIRRTVAWDLSAAERLGMWIFVHDAPANYHTTDGLVIYLQTSVTLVDYYRLKFRGTFMDSGWNYFASPLSRALVTGAPSWANIIRLSFEIWPVAGQVVNLSLDDLWLNYRGVPAVLLCFDDGYAAQYSVAFAHMKLHKIRGTLGAKTDSIGEAGYMTAAQLLEMNAAGWAIANHTNAGTDLTTLNEAEQTAQIQGGYDDLVALGLSRCAKYVIYPGGTYNDTTLTVMAALGMLTGRTTNPHTVRPMVQPVSHPLKLESTTVTSGVSLATAEGYVDTAIAEKSILPLHFHNLEGGANWDQATFDDFIDYLASKTGQIYPITIDDYYKLTLHSIRVPRII